MGPVTGRSKGRSQRRTEHPSPPDRTGAVCCERGAGASLTSTCCQNLWPSFLDQVYGSPPPTVAFIHQVSTKSLLYLGAVLDAASQGQRLSRLWSPSKRGYPEHQGTVLCGGRGQADGGAGPWRRCTWRKGLRARRPRPARKPPGEPAEPRGPGTRPCRLVFCCRLLPPLRLPFFLFKFSTKPEIELIHQTDVI